MNDIIIIVEENCNNSEDKYYVEGTAGLFGLAAYLEENGNIVIYEKNLLIMASREINDFDVSLEDEHLFCSILTLGTIFHELEHANQSKEIKESNDLEGTLLRTVRNNEKDTTITLYNYSLEERLANIKSACYLVKLCNYFALPQEMIEYFFNDLEVKIIHGYEYKDEKGFYANEETGKLVSPTESFISDANCDKVSATRILSSLEENDRILYGAPLTDLEFKELTSSTSIKM